MKTQSLVTGKQDKIYEIIYCDQKWLSMPNSFQRITDFPLATEKKIFTHWPRLQHQYNVHDTQNQSIIFPFYKLSFFTLPDSAQISFVRNLDSPAASVWLPFLNKPKVMLFRTHNLSIFVSRSFCNVPILL